MRILLALVALCGTVHAGGPESWASLYDGRLSQSIDQDPAAAIAIYEAMISHTPKTDPMRGELLYWLGRARWSAGDEAGAKKTLQSAAKTVSGRERARALLSRLVAQDKAIRTVPYLQEFGLDTGSLVRGWTRGVDDDLRWVEGPGGRVAAWNTEVIGGSEDFLISAFDTDGVRVKRIRLQVWTETIPTYLRIMVETAKGERWTAPLAMIEAGAWTTLDLPLAAFVSASAPAASGSPRGDQLRWLVIKDVTAAHSEDRGENRIFIDDLEVR